MVKNFVKALFLILLMSWPSNAQFVPFAFFSERVLKVSIDDVTVTEGNDFVFTVSLSYAPTISFTVDYTTSNNTAVAGTHFTAASGTLTINPGNTTGQITVTGLDPADVCQVDKNFNLDLSNPNLGELVDATGVGTIQDNDLPTISISDGSDVTEGANATLTVSLSAVCNTAAVSVEASTVNGTANAGQDYTAISSQLYTITAGNPSVDVVVATTDDALDEDPSQNFTVTLANPSNGTISDGSGSQNILDNDLPPNLTITSSDTRFEGETPSLNVSLDAASERPISFDYGTSDGTASSAAGDYTAVGTTTVTIPALSTSTSISLTALDDPTTCEDDETYTVSYSNFSNVSYGGGPSTITIRDVDLPEVQIGTLNQAEGSVYTFTVNLSFACPDKDHSFDYFTSDLTTDSSDLLL